MKADLSKIALMMDNMETFIKDHIETSRPVKVTGRIGEDGFQFGFIVHKDDKSPILQDILGTLIAYNNHVFRSIDLANELRDMIELYNNKVQPCTDQGN